MSLRIEFKDEELPELLTVLNRALNCWDLRLAPKWCWELEKLTLARLEVVRQEELAKTVPF